MERGKESGFECLSFESSVCCKEEGLRLHSGNLLVLVCQGIFAFWPCGAHVQCLWSCVYMGKGVHLSDV